MLIMITVWYPYNKALELTRKVDEVFKAKPYPPYIKLLTVGGCGEKTGGRAVDIVEVEKGRFEDAWMYITAQEMQIALGVEGYTFKLEALGTTKESAEVMGTEIMEPHKDL
jgi:hypothetical protein